jgi:hypothetical protein
MPEPFVFDQPCPDCDGRLVERGDAAVCDGCGALHHCAPIPGAEPTEGMPTTLEEVLP